MMSLDFLRGWPAGARAAALGAALAVGLAACGETEQTTAPSADEPAAPQKVVYHRGNTAEPSSLDPHRISGTWESHIGRDLFLGLMTDSAKGEPIYGAATGYEVSEDGLTWTWTMREGHVWSDGTPVTADDFVFSYRRIMDPNTAAEYASILYPIKNARAVNFGEVPVEELGVSAPNPGTLVIELEHPASYLPEMLTHQALFPVPKHVVEAEGDRWVQAGTMVTNGAYMLNDWRPNDFVHLVKNPNFYDAENVRIDEVFFYPTDNIPAALRRFRAGELDSNNDFPIQQIDFLRENFPEETRVFPYLATNYVIFNTTSEPFTNGNIRMAMAMAIDRGTIARDIMKTDQVPAYNLVPPGIRNYPHTSQFEWSDWTMEQRIEEARKLMEAEGYSEDNPLQVIYRHREGIDNKRRAVAVAAMWQQVWVNVQLQNTEVKTHYADLRSGNFLVADAGWVADFNDAKNYLFLLESKTGQLNYGNYNNPAYDALLDQSDMTVEPEERGRLLAEAEQIMLNDAPLIPVLFDTSRNLVGSHLVGFEDNANDYHPTRFMSIDESKRRTR